MSTRTIPRTTTVLVATKDAQIPGGQQVAPGTLVQVDADDAGALIASGDFRRAPNGARPAILAQLRPELPAPPDPVRVRVLRGSGASRQYAGVSRQLGDEFEVDEPTARAWVADGFAERA